MKYNKSREELFNGLVEWAQNSNSLEEKQEALEVIHRLLEPFRYALARKFANKGVDFDDLIQQIDLILIESVYNYDKEKDPSALRHITSRTRNGTWNFYRKTMNYFDEEKQMVSLDAMNIYISGNGHNDYTFNRYDIIMAENFDEDGIIEKIMIEEELEKLTPHQREVLFMFYVDDKRQEAIAEELNINQSNVSRAKSRGIKFLQDRFSSSDVPSDTHSQQ